MHRSRLAALVIDSQVDNIDSATDFWSRALGLAALPSEADSADKYAQLDAPGLEPNVLLQKVGHPSRVHLDIETDDIMAEVARLEQLGAQVVEVLPRWTVMQAPTGHRFCVVNPQRADFATAASVNNWP